VTRYELSIALRIALKDNRNLKKQVLSLKKQIESNVKHISNFLSVPYIPSAMMLVPDKTLDLDALPDLPGIYFIWHDEKIVYVGQSICLANRVHLGHLNCKLNDMVSWLVFPIKDLDWFEHLYIGMCRPSRNKGRHYKEEL